MKPSILENEVVKKSRIIKHYGFSEESPDRIITEKSSFFYDKVNGKNSLVQTVEWDTRFHEPLYELKKYTYFDNNGNQIYPKIN